MYIQASTCIMQTKVVAMIVYTPRCTINVCIEQYKVLLISHAGFVEPPTAINATLGSEAHFHCRVDVGIQLFWRINETNSNELGILPTVRTENQMLVSSLQVPASRKYNNSMVECAIILRDENGFYVSIYSDPVYLQIQGL